MKETITIREKMLKLSSILIPILITQLGLYSMTFFDTTMSGRVHPNDLAGVAIGSSIWVPINTGLSGILLGVTPIIAHLAGAKKIKDVPKMVVQALYLSVILSILIFIIGFFVLDPILSTMNLEREVLHIAKGYLVALSFGILPLFIYSVLRCFIDALGFTRVTMFITLTSLPINFLLNYLFIFGNFGFPKLGGIGSGVATAITYWCITAIAVVIIMKKTPFLEYQIFNVFYRISFSAWKEILKIGVPIGFAIFFETSIFAAVTLFMSQYNTITIASHQAAMNFASFLYMLPLSISMALTIIIGHEVGANRLKDAKQYSYLGIGMALFLSFLSATMIYFFRPEIANLYTTDAAVLKLTQDFLIYAIFFQLSDAIAAPIQGALRGYKDVNVTFLMALVSYWIVGLPFGYLLATYTSLGAFGYWIGLISGLAAGAIGLLVRLRIIQQRNTFALKVT
ncbi:MATE family efflux transporter [Metabacillus rhizolycopersici]|uniref:Probable multidrug resistance protein NorM n=1 Tax=Metabacillus rhizolycopersici TaxID=2875709 RepID=A0ABS7ULP5_9BACI|nr:MATE family efflux transporter [Metabacillus rhizolycopersici]MBZ5749242.1 MATE family efflux transporter [Metabacillus rhizolycopersici]